MTLQKRFLCGTLGDSHIRGHLKLSIRRVLIKTSRWSSGVTKHRVWLSTLICKIHVYLCGMIIVHLSLTIRPSRTEVQLCINSQNTIADSLKVVLHQEQKAINWIGWGALREVEDWKEMFHFCRSEVLGRIPINYGGGGLDGMLITFISKWHLCVSPVWRLSLNSLWIVI